VLFRSELGDLIDEEIDTHHAELERVAGAINRMGDGLPAFGIVAAVLGVITTMGSILEPPEVLGALIGAALGGTFAGVLLAYGLVAPIGAVLTTYCDDETKYYQCIKAGLIAHMQGYAPGMAPARREGETESLPRCHRRFMCVRDTARVRGSDARRGRMARGNRPARQIHRPGAHAERPRRIAPTPRVPSRR